MIAFDVTHRVSWLVASSHPTGPVEGQMNRLKLRNVKCMGGRSSISSACGCCRWLNLIHHAKCYRADTSLKLRWEASPGSRLALLGPYRLSYRGVDDPFWFNPASIQRRCAA